MIDVNKDMGDDLPKGVQGEQYCKTLHEYHKSLWSKRLPNGNVFDLEVKDVIYDEYPVYSLSYKSALGEFTLTSDWMCNTFLDWHRVKSIVAKIDKNDTESFDAISTRIGNYIIFPKGTNVNTPKKRVNGRWSPDYNRKTPNTTWGINSARGLDDKISDRLDLTLDCIRLWYCGIRDTERNPLAVALDYSKEFLCLFGSFPDYVKFFLLDDLVDSDYTKVMFWLPFEGFSGEHNALPQSVDEYKKYMSTVTDFIKARNCRIKKYSSKT